MLNKKSYVILFVSLLITVLVGCGGGGDAANLYTSNGSTSSSGAQLESISVTPTNPTLAVYTSQQFIATGIYSDNTTQDLTSYVTWTSSAVDVASGVDEARFTGLYASDGGSSYRPGHITATHWGRARITAKSGSTSGSTIVTVTPATLVSIAVTPTNPSIVRGTTHQFTATGTFSDNTTQDLTTSVTWNSSAAAIAAISSAAGSNGLASSTTAGSTTITATSGSISGSTTLTVTSVTLVSIEVTPTNPSIVKGTTRQFTATGIYSDNTTQDLTTAVTWGSSAGGVATISNVSGSKGLTTSAAAGSTTITATSGSISGSTTLTVTGATLVSIAVTPTNPSIVNGTTRQFTATGTYSDNTTQDLTTALTWGSLTGGVATISNAAGSKGLATSVAAGSTTITATSGSISGSTTLTVTPATLVSISVTPTNPSIALGTTRQFTATGTYSDNTTQNLTTAVTWGSLTGGVATISNAAGSNGLATPAAAGSTTITATSGSISGSTTLTVTAATLVSIAVTPTNPSIVDGTTRQFTATGTYSDSTTQDLTTSVTWGSLTGGVATISNAAGSKGLATSVTAGSTTITATSGSKSGSTTLTVTPATLVSIAVTPTNPSIVDGTTRQFTATGTYSDSTTQNLTTTVTWGSLAGGVATISNVAGSKGLATSVAAGSTTITATSGSISGSTTLTVTPATLLSIAVTPTNPSIALGTTRQFTATGTYSDNTTQDLTTAVTWNTSAASIATISNAAGSKGLATSVAAGSTTITATSGNISGTATLAVTGGGVATLTWDAPTTNTDGSSLNPVTELSMYKIYYGTASQNYTQVVTITNPGTTTITHPVNLSSGTYYFTVTTVNTAGQESSYSNEAMRTI
jgi:trimeric autotransporter adhesin